MCLGVIQGYWQHTIQQNAYDFLFEFNRNYDAISYCCRDIIAYFPNIKEVTSLTHVTVTKPLSWKICCPQAGTCYDQHVHQI